jgi:hypothetical protein
VFWKIQFADLLQGKSQLKILSLWRTFYNTCYSIQMETEQKGVDEQKLMPGSFGWVL